MSSPMYTSRLSRRIYTFVGFVALVCLTSLCGVVVELVMTFAFTGKAECILGLLIPVLSIFTVYSNTYMSLRHHIFSGFFIGFVPIFFYAVLVIASLLVFEGFPDAFTVGSLSPHGSGFATFLAYFTLSFIGTVLWVASLRKAYKTAVF